MFLKRWHWYGLLVVLIGGGGWFLLNPKGSGSASTAAAPVRLASAAPLASTAKTSPEPEGRLTGAVLVEQDEASSAWEVYADEAILFETTGIARAQGVQAELFENQQPLLWLRADEGEVYRNSGDITVKGHVQVKHQAGYTILTEALDWEAKSRRLQTDESVDIQGPAVHVTGMGLRSDVDQQRFSLQRDVRASFQLRNGQLRDKQLQAGQK